MNGLRVAILKVLGDKVSEVSQQARTELLEGMDDLGVEKIAAKLPDGTKVASVSRAGGGELKARVVDETALLKWVKANRPDEIEEKIRPAYRKALLDQLSRDGEEVPGVELSLSTAYVSVRFTSDGREQIERAWYSGALTLPEVLAIEPGEAADE